MPSQRSDSCFYPTYRAFINYFSSSSRLQEKHPPASSTDKSFADPNQFTPLAVDEAAVRKAVMSFPAGSSGGLDGLRPQHLKE